MPPVTLFAALADPSRCRVLELLRERARPVHELAAEFDISRPAISRHVRILTECGLLVIRRQGRERYCQADLRKLKQVADWTERYREFWTKKLDALEEYLEKDSRKKK